MAEQGFTGEDREALRTMVQLLKHIFHEAVLAGFSQKEAMELTSLTLQRFLGSATTSTPPPH
jgi:hypothetical protein